MVGLVHKNIKNEQMTDSPSIDAFARFRVSEPYTIFDVKQLHDNAPLYFDEALTGGGTSVHSSVNAATTMGVSSNGDSVIRQSKMRYNYQPGKSILITMTGVIGAPVTNVTRRIGAFDANNGMFFELADDILGVVIRKTSSDTLVEQSNWNLDKLDGTGSSGISLDTSKAQIFVIDYEWLGVGRVRFGFIIDGIIHYCHQFGFANVATSVYTSTPNQPLRYEISSTGGAAELVHICTSVIAEGGFDPGGTVRTHSTGTTHLDADLADTIYAILGIRLKSEYLDSTIIPVDLSIIAETNDNFRWILSINPTIAGTFTYTDTPNCACQRATGTTANTVSNLGISIAEGYASVETKQVIQNLDNVLNTLRLGSTIAGVVDELVLSVMPLTNTADMHASMSWRVLS